MKIIETHDLVSRGKVPDSLEWKTACDHVRQAVLATDWPHGSGQFTIFPESGKKRGEGNGVGLIKVPCIRTLRALGWQTEHLPRIESGTLTTRGLDALLTTKVGYIGFKWETGDIPSTHRAIDKLLLTLKLGGVAGGFLVLPSNKLKVYLTVRIGNIGELRPYFGLWQNTRIRKGALQIIVVEHDATSLQVPRIPKRTDGRALG